MTLVARADGNARPVSEDWCAYDSNGNVILLTDEAANPTARYQYDAFGKTLTATGPAAEANPYRFSTKPIEPGSGLAFYGYRYYSPELGRWPSRDPLGEWDRLNAYEMARSNPNGLVDILGLLTVSLAGGGPQYDSTSFWIGFLFPSDQDCFCDLSNSRNNGTGGSASVFEKQGSTWVVSDKYSGVQDSFQPSSLGVFSVAIKCFCNAQTPDCSSTTTSNDEPDFTSTVSIDLDNKTYSSTLEVSQLQLTPSPTTSPKYLRKL